jgi:hypothetical protein
MVLASLISDSASLSRSGGRNSRRYWKRSIGSFYSNYPHRLLSYLILAVAYIFFTFFFGFLFHGQRWWLSNLTFVSAFALHMALLYTACYAVVDILANQLGPKTYRYEQRLVGRQWLVMFIGFVMAYALHRSTYDSVVGLYNPNVVAYFNTYPDMRRTLAADFILYCSWWATVAYTIIQFSLHNQGNKAPERIQTHAGKESKPDSMDETAAPVLVHQAGSESLKIDHAKISHVSVEDHYCRIHHQTGGGVGNHLLRLTMKQVLAELNSDGFFSYSPVAFGEPESCARLEKGKAQAFFGDESGDGTAHQPQPHG